MFEDTKGVIRSRKSNKNIQYNDQKKKDKRTSKDLQNTTQTTTSKHILIYMWVKYKIKKTLLITNNKIKKTLLITNNNNKIKKTLLITNNKIKNKRSGIYIRKIMKRDIFKIYCFKYWNNKSPIQTTCDILSPIT